MKFDCYSYTNRLQDCGVSYPRQSYQSYYYGLICGHEYDFGVKCK